MGLWGSIMIIAQDVDRTLVEHWDGAQWSLAPSPNAGTGNNSLAAVVAISANDVWAAGSYIATNGIRQTLTLHGTARSGVLVQSQCCLAA